MYEIKEETFSCYSLAYPGAIYRVSEINEKLIVWVATFSKREDAEMFVGIKERMDLKSISTVGACP